MANYTVKQGDCLSSIAARFGLSGWEQLHGDAANAQLKEKRPNPNILAPGDQVAIPDPGEKKIVPIATGKYHTFVLQQERVKLRIALVTRGGKPYDVKQFIVNVGDREIKKKSAPGGIVEVDVPALAETARLRVWLGDDAEDGPPTLDRDLAIGHINPVDLKSGVQGRLANLGYGCAISDEEEGEADDQLLTAARAFRANQGLPEIERPGQDDGSGGEGASTDYAAQLMDDAFRSQLLKVYESSAAS